MKLLFMRQVPMHKMSLLKTLAFQVNKVVTSVDQLLCSILRHLDEEGLRDQL